MDKDTWIAKHYDWFVETLRRGLSAAALMLVCLGAIVLVPIWAPLLVLGWICRKIEWL